MTQWTKFLSASPQEDTASFRLGIVGDLLTCDLGPGDLTSELKRRAALRYRPPGSKTTRTYHYKTLQRWYLAAKRDLRLLRRRSRKKGFALALTEEQRQILLDVRRAHPSAAADLILSEAERNGLVDEGLVSVSTLRRFYRAAGLTRQRLNRSARRQRRRWEAAHVGAVWHADVCHVFVRQPDGTRKRVLVHAIMDDCGRFVVAIEAKETETEVDMLALLCTALLQHPAPGVLYLDNGACYSGKVLQLLCQRLSIRLVHAEPYDPQARGKMERFWATMRGQCTNFLDIASVHDVNAAVLAWVDESYHRRPHAGLMGKTPSVRYRVGQARLPAPTAPEILAAALEVTIRRRVRRDNTVSIDGRTFDVTGQHLVGRTVDVTIDPLTAEPIRAAYDNLDVPIALCDPKANARRSRAEVAVPETKDVSAHFSPIAGLLAAVRKGGHRG